MEVSGLPGYPSGEATFEEKVKPTIMEKIKIIRNFFFQEKGHITILVVNENLLFIPHVKAGFWSWIEKGLWHGPTSAWAPGIKI